MTARPCGFKSHLPHYAVIAQLGERVLDVDEVAGSSPAGRTLRNPRKFKKTLDLRGFCCYGEDYFIVEIILGEAFSRIGMSSAVKNHPC